MSFMQDYTISPQDPILGDTLQGTCTYHFLSTEWGSWGIGIYYSPTPKSNITKEDCESQGYYNSGRVSQSSSHDFTKTINRVCNDVGYYYLFVMTGDNYGTTGPFTVSVQCIHKQSATYYYNSGTPSPITPQSPPQDIQLRSGECTVTYNNNFAGNSSYRSMLFKYDGGWQLVGDILSSSTSYSTRILASSLSYGYSVRYMFASGSSKTSYTPYVKFTISKPAVESTAIYGYKDISSSTYTDTTITTQGQLVDIGVGKTIDTRISYANNYASSAYPISIWINDVKVKEGITSPITYSLQYSSNTNFVVYFKYGAEDNLVTDIYCAVSIHGIIIGRGDVTIAGINTHDTTNVVVPAFYPHIITLENFSGYDTNTRYTWGVIGLSSSDYRIESEGEQSVLSNRITLYNPTSNYKIYCNVKSYSVTKQYVLEDGHTIKCELSTVAIINSITPTKSDTGELITVIGRSVVPKRDGYEEGGYKWEITDLSSVPLVEGTDYTVESTGSTFSFKMIKSGTFYVKLTSTTTLSGYSQGTDTAQFTTQKITDIVIPYENRCCIVLYNESYSAILTRTTSDVIFMGLQYTSCLNSIGKCSFNVIGANHLGNAMGSLMKSGTKVIIYDKLIPIWSGIVSSVSDVNVNYYQSLTTTTYHTIECDECIKELSYGYLNDLGTVSGTISSLARTIIPDEHRGTIEDSETQYGLSISSASRLSILDSLANQCGWKYRCNYNLLCAFYNLHPTDIQLYEDGKIISYNAYILRVYDFKRGDIVLCYDGYTKTVICVGVVDSLSYPLSSLLYIHLKNVYKIDDKHYDRVYMSVYRNWTIDFKSTYYENFIPLSLKINDCAQNVDCKSTTADKYGEVCVYGVGNSGENISSTMRAWMKIGIDYFVYNSARVMVSYDSTIDSVNVLSSTTDKTVFSIILNGWSFPNDMTDMYPTIFYKDDTIRKITLTPNNGTWTGNIKKYLDQTNCQKTQIIVWCSNTDTIGSRKMVDVISSLPTLTNVIFNRLKIVSDYLLYMILPENGKIRIGDMVVTVSGMQYGLGRSCMLYFNWEEGGSVIPHGHLTDVLVMDDSGTMYDEGYSYENPDPNSPYAKYNGRTITIQGAEGYSRMELERVACRYMQYGSNYTDRGDCDIIFNAFLKSNYDIGYKSLPIVGDRFVLERVIQQTSNATVYDKLNYELLSYTVILDNNMVSAQFGMPEMDTNSVLYNIMSTSGMSIVSSDSNI